MSIDREAQNVLVNEIVDDLMKQVGRVFVQLR